MHILSPQPHWNQCPYYTYTASSYIVLQLAQESTEHMQEPLSKIVDAFVETGNQTFDLHNWYAGSGVELRTSKRQRYPRRSKL
jgi:hypothetical protein